MRLPVCFTLLIIGVLLHCFISEARSTDSSKSLDILLKVLLGKREGEDLSETGSTGNVDQRTRSMLATLQQQVAALAENMSLVEGIDATLQRIQDMAEDTDAVQEEILEYLEIAGEASSNGQSTQEPTTTGQDDLEWVAYTIGQEIPPDAVIGGSNHLDETLYVCRATHRYSFTPGKMLASKQCSVSWGGSEHIYNNFQVLTNPNDVDLAWVMTDPASMPAGAVEGGEDAGGTLYIGRNEVEANNIAPGKVFPPNELCYSSYQGLEREFDACEVLVIVPH